MRDFGKALAQEVVRRIGAAALGGGAGDRPGPVHAADDAGAAAVGDLSAGMWRRKVSLLPRYEKLGLESPSR